MLDMLTKPLLLILFSAIGYAGATLAMKSTAMSPSLISVLIIVGLGTAGVICEVMALRDAKMALVYLSILGTEALLIIGLSALIGEGLTIRQMAGAILVLLGAAVLSA